MKTSENIIKFAVLTMVKLAGPFITKHVLVKAGEISIEKADIK